MINRDSRGHQYSIVRGEILGFIEDKLLRKHLPRMFSLISERKLGDRRRSGGAHSVRSSTGNFLASSNSSDNTVQLGKPCVEQVIPSQFQRDAQGFGRAHSPRDQSTD